MCHSGLCRFERGWIGDCPIRDYKKFVETYGFDPCMVGGRVTDEEDEAFYNEHKEQFDEIYDKWDQTEGRLW